MRGLNPKLSIRIDRVETSKDSIILIKLQSYFSSTIENRCFITAVNIRVSTTINFNCRLQSTLRNYCTFQTNLYCANHMSSWAGERSPTPYATFRLTILTLSEFRTIVSIFVLQYLDSRFTWCRLVLSLPPRLVCRKHQCNHAYYEYDYTE